MPSFPDLPALSAAARSQLVQRLAGSSVVLVGTHDEAAVRGISDSIADVNQIVTLPASRTVPNALTDEGRFIVVLTARSVTELDRQVHELCGWTSCTGVDVSGGVVVLECAGSGGGPIPPDFDAESLIARLIANVRELWEADLHAAHAEHDQLLQSVEQTRSSAVGELSRLREAHRRDIAKVKQSGRYQLGDIVVGAVRSPHTITSIPSRIRRLRTQRAQVETADPHRAPVVPRRPTRIGAVLDEFSWSCFEHEARLVELDPGALDAQTVGSLDLVLVESAWQGNQGKWRYSINKFAEREPKPLRQLVELCHDADVPAVFWNKEDPVNYEVFLAAAKEFSMVLTTDADRVDAYVRDLGHDRVAALAFAAQPRLHNPIGRSAVLQRACFAGAWRGDKYTGRRDDFAVLLDPLLTDGLVDIFDRYADHPRRDELGFPDRYRSAVRGSLPYDEMVEQYRKYAVFLNVNSVTESPTMFSRRVFEILACGTPVISTYSRGIEEMLGEHVMMPSTPRETRAFVETMIEDPAERERRGHLGYRHVHRTHTYGHRLDQVLDFAGLISPSASTRPQVSVVSVSNRPDQLEHAIESFTSQSYEDAEFIFVANSSAFDREHVAQRVAAVRHAQALFVDESATLADCLNEAMTVARGRFIAKFDDDDDYGVEYLADMMLTFGYSGAAVAGKRSYYAYVHEVDKTVLRFPGREFSFVPAVVGGTIVFDRNSTGSLRFTPVERGTDTVFLDDCRAAGLKVFSADRFNFLQHRHPDLTRHTWRIPTAQFMEASVVVADRRADQEVFL